MDQENRSLLGNVPAIHYFGFGMLPNQAWVSSTNELPLICWKMTGEGFLKIKLKAIISVLCENY